MVATAEEVEAKIGVIKGHVERLDAKLDDIRELVASLKAGDVLSQEQLDAFDAALSEVSDRSASVVDEADAIAPNVEPVDPEE